MFNYLDECPFFILNLKITTQKLLSSFLVILFYKNNFTPHIKTNMGGKMKGKGKKGGDPAKG